MLRPALPYTIVTLIAALVGAVDTAIRGHWALFVIFVLIGLVQIVVLFLSSDDRVPVSLRPDLARWASQRSHRTGEPVNDVIDRSVAWFQHGLYGAGQPDGD